MVLSITRSGGLTIWEGRFSLGHRCRRRRRRRRRRREDRHKQTWAQAAHVEKPNPFTRSGGLTC